MAAFIDFVGIGIIIPISPFYAQKFGATPLEIALLFTAYSAPQVVLSPLWGRFSDRYGRKPLLLVGLGGEFASYMLLAFAPSLIFLYISRVVSGGLSANFAVIQSYVADVTTEENRVRGLGLIGASVGLGFIVGPAIGGTLSVYGYRTPILLTAFLALVNLGLVLSLLKEPIVRRTKMRKPLREVFGYARPVYVSGGLVNLAFVGLQVTLALYVQALYGWGAFNVGLILAAIGVIEAVIQGGVVYRLTARLGEWVTASLGIGLLGVCFFALSIPLSIYVTVFALVLLGIGLSLSQPSANSIITKLTPAEEYGSALSLVQSITSLTNIAGQVVGGSLFQYVSVEAPYVFGLIAVVAGLLVFVSSQSRYKVKIQKT
ncbi:MAG: MFS transporter [Thermoprotei archaeon]